MMSFDGVPITALGLSARRLTGWMTPAALRRTATSAPSILGALPSTVRTSEAREMEVDFTLSVPSLTGRAAAFDAVRRFLVGVRRLRTDDAPGRFTVVDVSASDVASVAPGVSMTENGRNLVLSYRLVDYFGCAFADEPRVLHLTTTPQRIATGDAPTGGLVYVPGALAEGASRTLTYRNAAGALFGELTITPPADSGGLAATDVLEIDMVRRYLTRVSSAGVRTDVYNWLSAGDWFLFDGADSDVAQTHGPRLAISAGTAQLIYRLRYHT